MAKQAKSFCTHAQPTFGDGACFYYALLWSLQRLGLMKNAKVLDSRYGVRYDDQSVRDAKEAIWKVYHGNELRDALGHNHLDEGMRVVLEEEKAWQGDNQSRIAPLEERLIHPENACPTPYYATLTEAFLAATAFNVGICVHSGFGTQCFWPHFITGGLHDAASHRYPIVNLCFDEDSMHYTAFAPTPVRQLSLSDSDSEEDEESSLSPKSETDVKGPQAQQRSQRGHAYAAGGVALLTALAAGLYAARRSGRPSRGTPH